MYEKKCDAIGKYLSAKLGDAAIARHHDEGRLAQTFKVRMKHEPVSRLLKVSDELIDDNDISVILSRFDQWGLADRLRNEEQRGVIATHNGLARFDRD